ncbi:MAG: hypothetical protein HQ564_03775, partial [Candidatus Saganbacteria bacterium]|nr:hypothetical protein [Candidatus Saganbacteria bacterium]
PSTKFFENIGNAIGGAGKGIGGALGAAGKGIGGAIGGAGQGIGGFFGATAEGIGSAIGNVGNALGNIRIQLPQRAPEKEKVFEQEKIRKEIPAPLIKPQPQTLEESIDLLVNIIRGEAPLSDLGKALPQIATGMLVLSLKMGLFVFVLFVILALFKEWEKIARKK